MTDRMSEHDVQARLAARGARLAALGSRVKEMVILHHMDDDTWDGHAVIYDEHGEVNGARVTHSSSAMVALKESLVKARVETPVRSGPDRVLHHPV